MIQDTTKPHNKPRRVDAVPRVFAHFADALAYYRRQWLADFDVSFFEFKTNTPSKQSIFGVAHTEYQARQEFLRVYLLNSRQYDAGDLMNRAADDLQTAERSFAGAPGV